MKTIVDPPTGWMFGFPKELPEGKDYGELLREAGYPASLMDLAMKHSRYWTVEDDDDQTK